MGFSEPVLQLRYKGCVGLEKSMYVMNGQSRKLIVYGFVPHGKTVLTNKHVTLIAFLCDLRHPIATDSNSARAPPAYHNSPISCFILSIHDLAGRPLRFLPGTPNPEPSEVTCHLASTVLHAHCLLIPDKLFRENVMPSVVFDAHKITYPFTPNVILSRHFG